MASDGGEIMKLRDYLSDQEWLVEEHELDLERANVFETLFTVGNGYLGTRGAFEEGHRGELSGTYLAGVYDHHDLTIIDLINAPDWLPVSVWVDGVRLDAQTCKVLEHYRALDLKQGFLYRSTLFEDPAGRRTRIESVRLASLADRHLCAIRTCITAESHEAPIWVEGAIDGNRRNLDRMPEYENSQSFHPEVKWEKWAKSRHMQEVRADVSSEAVYLEMETLGTGHRLGIASGVKIEGAEAAFEGLRNYERVAQGALVPVEMGVPVVIDKTVSIFTSREIPADALHATCNDHLNRARVKGFDALFAAHNDRWAATWGTCDVVVAGDPRATLASRFNIYHLLITANPDDPKVNIGAKSLSGEGYKGHVFWDTEIFMLPFYIYTQPETARALMLYRYHTLDGARENATANGFSGAQYAWESADTGVETTPKWTADGKHRIWTGEEEIHVTADVAYGVLTYVNATGDWEFMRDYGAEILFETSRFWISRLEHNEDEGRFELTSVIGPDEFHEHVDNNTFTNCLARWHLQEAAAVYDRMVAEDAEHLNDLSASIDLQATEVADWRKTADLIHIPIDLSKDLIEQFSGYFDLDDIQVTEWDENGMPKYPEGLDHFKMNDTQLLKQPDVIMLLYVLPDAFDDATKHANYAFYEPRTLHKSSLSPAVHAIMGIEVGDPAKALSYFQRSAFVDLADNQGNTQDGIHAASTGGTWQALVFGFGGFRVKEGRMTFKPWLPRDWDGLKFNLIWHGATLSVAVDREAIELSLSGDDELTEEVTIFDQPHVLVGGEKLRVEHPDS